MHNKHFVRRFVLGSKIKQFLGITLGSMLLCVQALAFPITGSFVGEVLFTYTVGGVVVPGDDVFTSFFYEDEYSLNNMLNITIGGQTWSSSSADVSIEVTQGMLSLERDMFTMRSVDEEDWMGFSISLFEPEIPTSSNDFNFIDIAFGWLYSGKQFIVFDIDPSTFTVARQSVFEPFSLEIDFSVVSEPPTFPLFVLGFMGLWTLQRRRKLSFK